MATKNDKKIFGLDPEILGGVVGLMVGGAVSTKANFARNMLLGTALGAGSGYAYRKLS